MNVQNPVAAIVVLLLAYPRWCYPDIPYEPIVTQQTVCYGLEFGGTQLTLSATSSALPWTWASQ